MLYRIRYGPRRALQEPSSSPLSGLPTFLGVRARSPKTNSIIAGTIHGGMWGRFLRGALLSRRPRLRDSGLPLPPSTSRHRWPLVIGVSPIRNRPRATSGIRRQDLRSNPLPDSPLHLTGQPVRAAAGSSSVDQGGAPALTALSPPPAGLAGTSASGRPPRAGPGEVADHLERHLWVLRAGMDAEVAVAAIRVQLLARQRGAASGGSCSLGVASGTQSEPSSASRPMKTRATVSCGGGVRRGRVGCANPALRPERPASGGRSQAARG